MRTNTPLYKYPLYKYPCMNTPLNPPLQGGILIENLRKSIPPQKYRKSPLLNSPSKISKISAYQFPPLRGAEGGVHKNVHNGFFLICHFINL